MNKINLLFSSIIFLLVITTSSCKNDNSTSPTQKLDLSNGNQVHEILSYEELLANVKKDDSSKNINALFEGLIIKIRKVDAANPERKKLLEDGLKFCTKYKRENYATSFYLPLLKDYPDNEQSKDYIFEMATIMKKLKKTSASDVLFSNFAKIYSTDSRVSKAKENISSSFTNIESYLKTQADKAFKREAGTKIDRKVVNSYVDACEAYALSNPKSELAPTYLYKGSELARSVKSLQKVFSLYDWIIEKYPNFEKTPTVHFLKGFILENEAGNVKEAEVVYKRFLAKYPKHELADDVKFLIKNLGKSNDEILKMLGKESK